MATTEPITKLLNALNQGEAVDALFACVYELRRLAQSGIGTRLLHDVRHVAIAASPHHHLTGKLGGSYHPGGG